MGMWSRKTRHSGTCFLLMDLKQACVHKTTTRVQIVWTVNMAIGTRRVFSRNLTIGTASVHSLLLSEVITLFSTSHRVVFRGNPPTEGAQCSTRFFWPQTKSHSDQLHRQSSHQHRAELTTIWFSHAQRDEAILKGTHAGNCKYKNENFKIVSLVLRVA